MKSILVIVLLMAIVVLPLYVMLSSPDFQYCQQHQGQYPVNHAGDQESPAILIPNDEGRRIFFRCTSEFTDASAAAITAIATFFLTIATAILSVIAWRQYWTTRAQLRAYLVPVSAGIGATEAGVPYWNVVCKNSGPTPAYDVSSYAAMLIAEIVNEDRLLTIPPFEKHTPMTVGSDGVLPRQGMFVRAPTPAEVTGIGVMQPTHAIYVYGRVKYRDIFKVSHFSNFRCKYFGPWPPPEGTGIMWICDAGNDSD